MLQRNLEKTLIEYTNEYALLKKNQNDITTELNMILNRILNIEAYLMDKEEKIKIYSNKK